MIIFFIIAGIAWIALSLWDFFGGVAIADSGNVPTLIFKIVWGSMYTGIWIIGYQAKEYQRAQGKERRASFREMPLRFKAGLVTCGGLFVAALIYRVVTICQR